MQNKLIIGTIIGGLAIAAIFFATDSWRTVNPAVSDVVILRDRSLISGGLRVCNASTCTVDTTPIALATIEWIGLGRADPLPPAATSPTSDELHKSDGTIAKGRLTGITSTSVSTRGGKFTRAETAWIHLAPPVDDSDQPDQIGAPKAPKPATPPGSGTTAGNAGTLPPPPRSPRSPGNGVKQCPAAKPLGAHVELRINRTESTPAMERSSRVRVWFDLTPATRGQWRHELTTPWDATHMTWKTEASACVDLPDRAQEWVCKCDPSRGRGIADLAEGGYAHFYPVGPHLTMQFPNVIISSGDVTLECLSRSEGSRSDTRLNLDNVDVLPYGSGPNDFLVAPTGCLDASGRAFVPACLKQPELYAVIPFVGSQERTTEENRGEKIRTRMRWEVCCGCGKPPRDMPEGEKDPCGDDEQQRGLLEVAVARAVALRNEMAPHVEQLKQHWIQAQALESNFDLVVRSCAGWDIAMTLVGYLAGGANAPKLAQAFTAGLGILQQLLAQDPTVVLSAGGAFGLEGLEEANNVVSLYSTVAGFTSDRAGAGSLAGMRAKLEDCAKDPTQSGLVYADAKLYLDEVEQVFTEAGEIARLTTEISQADTEVMNRWREFHRACLENAACRGLDPAICGAGPQ